MPLVRLESSLYYEMWIRARSRAMMPQIRLTSPGNSVNVSITKTITRPPLCLLSAVAIGPSEPDEWLLISSILAARLR